MSYYSNPTENAALGNINKQWNAMKRVAKRIRRRRLAGTLTYPELYRACLQFRGMYSVLLMQAITQDEDPDKKPDSESCPG